MLEKWRKSLDKQNIAVGLLTDLSKVFDCLNRELLIANLKALSILYIVAYQTENIEQRLNMPLVLGQT